MTTEHHVYILVNAANTKTYVGYTVDPVRRLRQHNGELVGGARATHGDTWRMAYLVTSPQFDKHAALSFEWHMKWHRRRGVKGSKGAKSKRQPRQPPLEERLALFEPAKALAKFAHCDIRIEQL
jgi:predicted GIY-YIG superfamily endonuclease